MVGLMATAAFAISVVGVGSGGPTQELAGLFDRSTPKLPNATRINTHETPSDQGKTPLYVVMRMDDTNPIYYADNLTDVMNWFVDHNLKYNFGIIVGSKEWKTYWPSRCTDSPTDQFCDSPIVQRVNEAYHNGDVVGTGESAIFEIGSHGSDHNGWAEKWRGFVPDDDWSAFQENDLRISTTVLKFAYPKASIKYFAAPANMANGDTLNSLKRHGLEILSTAATRSCGSWGQFWYLTPPCYVQDNTGSFTATCMPEGDVWATTEGFARVQGIVSAPATCANSNWVGAGNSGITVDETIGVDDCGCRNGGRLCSLVGSAKLNAAKSNGLHWSVLMMHPQTVFPNGQTYPEWLDEFYEKVQALENYTVHFINFQDLARLHAPGDALVVNAVHVVAPWQTTPFFAILGAVFIDV